MEQDFLNNFLIKDEEGNFFVLEGDKLVPYGTLGVKSALDYEKLAQEVVRQSQVSFANPVLTEQFYNIILSRLKGVRDDLETKNYLTKPSGEGGLELDEAGAEQILKLIQDALQNKLTFKEEGVSKKASPPPEADRQEKLERIVGEIMANIKKDYPKDLDGRLRKIILTYLKDIRDKRETRDALEKPVISGGVGFSPERALKLVAFIDAVEKRKTGAAAVEKAAMKKMEKEIKREVKAEPTPLPKEPILPKEEARPSIKEKFLAPPPPAIVKMEEMVSEIKKIPGEIKDFTKREILSKEPPKPRPIPTRTPSVIKAPSLQVKKPKIEDIKYKPKLVGPIDELRSLTLKDFRKLAPSPEVAVEKIQEKINLLEEESFVKKIEGIKAWKQSPLNKMYLALGQKSIIEGRPVEEIVASSAAGDNLNKDEFNAIMELNKSLRL